MVESFHFDWCLYHRADKAVKTSYAGTHWDDAAFVAKLEEAARRMPLLAREVRTLQAGAYRAAFSPSAMVELLGTLGWSGFSLKSPLPNTAWPPTASMHGNRPRRCAWGRARSLRPIC